MGELKGDVASDARSTVSIVDDIPGQNSGLRDYITDLATATTVGLLGVFRGSNARNIFWLLVAVDLMFIAMHVVLRAYPELVSANFSVSKDNGYPEWYQYGKELFIVALCLFIAKYRGITSMYAWAPLFLYFLLDDSLKIHETAGGFVSSYFAFSASFGLRPQDFGELVASGLAALILIPPLLVAGWRADMQTKWIHIALAFLVFVLAFFGVMVDMVHSMLNWAPNRVRFVATLLEDGGEMVAMSAIVAFSFGLSIQTTSPKSET